MLRQGGLGMTGQESMNGEAYSNDKAMAYDLWK